MNVGLIIGVVIVVLIVVFGLAIFIFVLKKPAKDEHHEAKKSYTLQELVKLGESESSPAKLEELINIFLKTQSLPVKAGSLSKDAALKLEFVTALVLNNNTNAKLVVKLTKSLKTKYPAYKNDIEAAEQIAIAKRKMRS